GKRRPEMNQRPLRRGGLFCFGVPGRAERPVMTRSSHRALMTLFKRLNHAGFREASRPRKYLQKLVEVGIVGDAGVALRELEALLQPAEDCSFLAEIQRKCRNGGRPNRNAKPQPTCLWNCNCWLRNLALSYATMPL